MLRPELGCKFVFADDLTGLTNKRQRLDDSSDGSDSDSISEISDLDSISSESVSDNDSNPFGGSGSDSDEGMVC